MKKTTTRIAAILIALVLLIGGTIGVISASASPYYNTATVQKIEAALKSFEDKVGGGTIYTNMPTAYTKYVELSRILDRYYYGNENIADSAITNKINELNTAMGNMAVWSMPTPKNNNIADNAYNSTYVWVDDKNESNTYAKMAQYYTNVIWGETGGGSNWLRSEVTGTGNGSNITMSFYYPIYALVVDGVNTPKFAVMLRGVGNGGSKRYFYAASINNPESGISLERNWTSGSGVKEDEKAFNFGWNISTNTIEASYSMVTHSVPDKNAGQIRAEGGAFGIGAANYTKTYANYMLFTGSFAAGEYQKAVYPKLRTMLGSAEKPSGQSNGNWYNDIVINLDPTSNGWPIRILNYKVLVDTLKTGFAKFANVKQYREGGLTNLITALNAAMSYNYNTDFQGIGYDGVAGAVNTAAGKIQTYVNNINNAAITQDKYTALRSAIDSARALYFENAASAAGVGGENPIRANGRVKYCPTPWKTFAEAYAKVADHKQNASAVMWAAGNSGNYTDTTVNTLATALNTARTNVKEHIEGSTNYLQIPASNSEFYDAKYKIATCTEDGLVARLTDCPNCREAIYMEDVTINAAGHTNMTEHPGKDVTCTQDGAVTYYTCDRAENTAGFIAAGCGKIFADALGNQQLNSAPDPIPATEHKYILVQEGKEKSCLNGTFYEIWKCTACEKYFLDNTDLKSEDYVEYDAVVGEQNDKLDHTLQQHTPESATCEHPGNKEYWSCATCNTIFRSNSQTDIWIVTDEDTYVIPQLAHSFTKYTYDEGSQTCLTDGTETAYCDYESEQPIEDQAKDTRPAEGKEATGHNWDKDYSYTAPTCVTPGNIEYHHCSNCDTNYYDNGKYTTAVVTGETTLPIGEHNLVQHYAVKATCQNDGWETYYECGVCGQCFDSTACDNKIADTVNEISNWNGYTAKEKGEHVLIAHEAKEATCKEGDDGWDAYWQCALCNKFYSAGDQSVNNFENNLINVTDITQWEGYHPYTSVAHNVGEDLASDPTCAEEGFDTHFECSVCHKWFDAKENGTEIDEKPTADKNPNNHTGNWIEHPERKATCLQDGWSQLVYECADCGYYYTDKNDNDTTGQTAYTLETLKAEGIYTEKVDHNKDGQTVETITASTCVTLGYKQTTYYCTWCNTIQDVVVEQLTDYAAHTPNPVEYQAPTCMATGTEAHNTCSVCGQYFKAEDTDCTGTPLTEEEIAALVINSVGHDFSVEGELVTAATCTTNAIYEYSCSYGCNSTTQLEKADTRTGHNMTEHAQANATCLTDGIPETYYSCDICGLNYKDGGDYTTDIYSGELSTPATGHNFQLADSGTEATCKDFGSKPYYICTNDNCDLGKGTKFLSNADTKAAKGIDSDDELKIDKEPLNHTKLNFVEAKEPSCSPNWEDGNKAYIYCEGCKNYYAIDDILYEHPVDFENDIKIPATHTLTFYGAQAATCLKDGWNDAYVCDICSAVFKEDTPTVENGLTEEEIENDIILHAPGHTFTSYNDPVTATCKTEGKEGYVECDVCHIKQICNSLDAANKMYEGDDSDKIDLGLNPDNHEGPFVEVKGTEAGCIEDGVKDHYECSACGAKFMDDEGNTPATDLTIPATGHSFPEGSKHDAVLPTCTNPGTRMYYTCDNCHNNYALDDPKQVVVLTDLTIAPTYQHKLVAHNGRNATCVQEGYDSYYECSLCGKTFSSGNQGEATEEAFNEFNETYGITVEPTYGVHMFIHFSGVTATCTVAGYDEYWECAVCQKKFSSNNEEEMKADLKAFNEKYDITDTFAPAIDPDKHSIISTGGTPATCVAPGVAAHYECEWCHEWFNSDAKGATKVEKTPAEAPIDPNNHVNAWIEHTYQEATCQQEGWKQTVYECKACGAFYSAHNGAKTEAANKLADNKDGLSNEYYEAQKPHNMDETSEEELISSTCTTQGYKLVTYKCDMCHQVQKTELERLDLAKHDTNYVPEKAPTCMKTGVQAHFECSVCGKYFVATDENTSGDEIEDKSSVVLDRVNHSYEKGKIVNVLVDPTCTEYAIVEVECVYECGATTNRAATDADGEDYKPIGHDYEEHEGKDATCTEAGYETYYTCNNGCGTLFSAKDSSAIIDDIQYKDIDPNAHPEASVSKPTEGAAVEATCTENGWVERSYCEACGKYFADGIGPKESLEDPAFVVGALGHVYVEHEAKVSTCKTKGNDLYYTCSNEGCDLYFSAKDANRVIDGVPERDLDPTNHEVALTQIGEPKAATCLDTGLMAIYQCSACEKYFDNADGSGVARDSAGDASFVIPAKGHEFEFVTGNPATCVEGGKYYKDHYTCKNCDKHFLEATDRFSEGVDYDKDIKLEADPTKHTDLKYVEEKAADCEEWTNGMRAHYYCSGCGNYYEVSDLNNPVENGKDAFVVAPQHTLTSVAAHNATCSELGWEAYWECSECGTAFDTDQLTSNKEENDKHVIDLNIWKHYGDHLLIHHDAHSGDCQNLGWEEYYECAYCTLKFEDSDGNKEIKDFENEWKKLGSHDIRQTGGTPATCIAAGEDVHFECVICKNWFKDATGSEQIDKETPVTGINENNHVNGWIEHAQQTATCEQDGWSQTVYECAACGRLYSEHNEEITETDKKIANSIDELPEGVYTAKLAHNFTDEKCKKDTTVLQEASCILDGIQMVNTYCLTCGKVYVTNTVNTGKLAHKLTKNEQKDATCLEDGIPVTYYSCSECGLNYTEAGYNTDEDMTTDIYTGATVTPATGHNFVLGEEGTPGTCEEAGTVTYYVCSNAYCDLTKNGEKAKFVDITDTKAEEGASADELIDPLNPNNHTKREHVSATPANCVDWSTGMREHYYCEGCDNYYEVSDLGTSVGEGEEGAKVFVVEPQHTLEDKGELDATCIDDGYNHYWECSVCHEKFLADTPNVEKGVDYNEKIAITAAGHKFGEYIETEATCVVEGIAGHYECSVCNIAVKCDEADKDTDAVKYYKGDDSDDLNLGLDANNHKNIVDGESKEATCTEDGVLPHKVCQDCGATFELDGKTVKDNIVDPATGHSFKNEGAETPYQAPTCYDAGNIKYYTCDKCDGRFATDNEFSKVPLEDNQITIPATGQHTLVGGNNAKSATCLEDGWDAYWECSVCGKLFDAGVQEGDIKDFDKDHCFGDSIDDLKNWKNYTALGKHVLIAHEAKDATCIDGDDGWKAYWECALCGKCYSEDMPSEGYDYNTFEAKKIAETKDDISNWDGYRFAKDVKHTIEDDPASAATCVTPSYGEHYECSVCGKWFDDENGTNEVPKTSTAEIDPNNHTDNWIYNTKTDATCQATGFLIDNVQCADCGYYYADDQHTTVEERIAKEQVIDPIKPHNQETKEKSDIGSIEPTCTSAGQQMYYIKCSMCGAIQSTTVETVDMIPHKPTTEEAIKGSDPTCQVTGVKDHYECEMCHQYFADDDPTCTGDPIDIVIPTVDHDFTNKDADHTVIVTPADCWNDAKVEYLCVYDCGTHSTAEVRSDGVYGKLGHNFTEDSSHEYKAPSCLKDGNPEYYYCDRCDQNYSDSDAYTTNTFNGNLTIPATDHNFELKDSGTVPTCAAEGSKAYYECTNENCDLTVDGVKAKFVYDADTKAYTAIADDSELKLEKDPYNHTDGLAPQAAVAADCEKWQVGYRAHIYCTNCENYYEITDLSGKNPLENGKADLEIAPEHTLSPVEGQNATCEVDGWINYYECTVCGEKFLDDKTPDVENGVDYDDDIKLPATGHKGGEAVIENVVKGEDCQHHGSHDEVIYCANDWCDVKGGKELSREPKEDEVGPHVAGEPKWEDVVEPTCTENGHYDLVTRCTLCDEELARVKDQVIEKTGHSFTNYVSDENATCLTDGTETAKCDNCDETFTRTEENSATGHNFVLVDEKAVGATCLEDGVKAHYECANDNCDLTIDGVKAKFLDDTNPKAEEGVDDSELVIPKNLDPKSHVNLHFEKGFDPICSPWTVGMRDCFTCDCGNYYEVDDTYYKNAKSKADFEIAPQHTLADMGEQAATCEVDGYNHYWECTVEGCGQQFLAETPEVKTGVVYDDDIRLPKTGHNPAEAVIENVVKGENCQENGTHDEVVYCQNEWCDFEDKELSREQKTDEPGPHVPGDPQWEDVVEPTCTEDGYYDLVTRCELCNTELDRVPDQVIDAKGHDWGEWETVESPDCENGGSAKRTCPDCGTVETKDLDPNGHEWETDENGDEQYTIDKEPTCTEDGSQSIHCKNCDAQKDSETLPATGHDWSDWETVVEPDCENGGSAERTCPNCGTVETKDLDPNGHDWEEDYTIDEAPTCTEEGSKSIHCKNCDETKNSETVPALGHDIVTDPAVPPTATENGLTEGEHCSRGDYKKEQQVIPATGEYALAFLEGEDQLYIINSNEVKTIVCSGNYNMFVELLLNGVRVDASNYTLAEGSTIVTFKPEYLNTLAPGKYKVTLVYTYDSIDTTLTVVEKVTEAPGNTSTTSPLTGLAITIPVFSLAALAGGFFSLGYARKKKNEDKD